MAERDFTMIELPGAGDEQAWLVTWSGLLNGDTGKPVELIGFADRCVQVEGTFGTGGNLQVQGSNDDANYRALHDPAAVVLDIGAAGFAQVLEMPRKMRPAVTNGDGTTNLAVSAVFRRTRR